MGWVQAQLDISPLFPKRTLCLVKDKLASSKITLRAKSSKHHQYVYPLLSVYQARANFYWNCLATVHEWFFGQGAVCSEMSVALLPVSAVE